MVTKIMVVLTAVAVLPACDKASKGYDTPSTVPPSSEVSTNTSNIDKNADRITVAAEDSKGLAQEIKGATVDPQINSKSDGIISNSDLILDSAESIKESTQNLEKANTNILILEQTIAKLNKDNEKLKAEAIKKLYSIIGIMFGVSMLLIVGGGVLMFFVPTSKSLGMILVGAGVISLSVSVGATYYLQQIAQIGLGVLVLAIVSTIAYVIYELAKKNGIFLRANQETILLVEEIKKVLPDDVKIQIFGTKERIVDKIQSKETQDLIKYLKKEIED